MNHENCTAPESPFTDEQWSVATSQPAIPILERMCETYHERRAAYGPSEQRFADVMVALFPEGLTLRSRTDWLRYGLFHQLIGKLSRYVRNFREPHVDSMHDLGVYAAMLEAEDRRALGMAPFTRGADR